MLLLSCKIYVHQPPLVVTSFYFPDLQRVALKVDLVSSVGGFSLGTEGKGKEHSKLPHHEGEDLCCQAVVAYLTSCLAQDK